jgi:hypothetical protein
LVEEIVPTDVFNSPSLIILKAGTKRSDKVAGTIAIFLRIGSPCPSSLIFVRGAEKAQVSGRRELRDLATVLSAFVSEGRPKIAHRFNGGKATTPTLLLSPVRDG